MKTYLENTPLKLVFFHGALRAIGDVVGIRNSHACKVHSDHGPNYYALVEVPPLMGDRLSMRRVDDNQKVGGNS